MSLQDIYSVILNNGRICQISLDLSSSPVLTLCDNLNTTDKENSGCPRTCIYGIKQADDTCTCSNGHYGTVPLEHVHVSSACLIPYIHVLGQPLFSLSVVFKLSQSVRTGELERSSDI
jgi:hypothetical protein